MQDFIKKRNYTIDELLNYDPKDWLQERPKELTSVLTRLCNVDFIKFDDKNAYRLARLVEQIYHLKNTHILLPLQNILLYSYTSSKQATNFISSFGPAGTILRCLDASAEHPFEVPKGVCRVAFDNSQVVGKTYTVASGITKFP